MVDRDDDVKIGVEGTAIPSATSTRLMINAYCRPAPGASSSPWALSSVPTCMYVGLGLMTLLFSYQRWLIRHRQRDGCLQTFRSNIWVNVCLL